MWMAGNEVFTHTQHTLVDADYDLLYLNNESRMVIITLSTAASMRASCGEMSAVIGHWRTSCFAKVFAQTFPDK